MKSTVPLYVGLFTAGLPFAASQASCSSKLSPTNSIKPSIASGYEWSLVATGLSSPRSLVFDSSGNLLVVEQNKGITSHKLKDDGGACLSISSSKTLIDDDDLNHGIALSEDGKTLYASSSDEAYSWSYDDSNSSVDEDSKKTLVKNMEGSDHTTRTLLIPRLVKDMLVISRGSDSNVDDEAKKPSSGHSTIKSFDLSSVPDDGYEYDTDGDLLGYGLRNDVGVVEHPKSGGIWSVENSVDQLKRDGKDIHQDNPGEELNFLGYLNGTKAKSQGTSFGYPGCYTAWDPSALPENSNLEVGTPFSTSSSNDGDCKNTTAPRLTWQAHTAPLDIKFNNSATEAWVSLHGSWNRDDPVGYSVEVLGFSDSTYEPSAPSNSNTSLTTIFFNSDNSDCPDNCFRPVGLALDDRGRLFVASDDSGEIYVIVRTSAKSVANATGTGGGSGSGSGDDNMAPSRNVGLWTFAMLAAGLVFSALI